MELWSKSVLLYVGQVLGHILRLYPWSPEHNWHAYIYKLVEPSYWLSWLWNKLYYGKKHQVKAPETVPLHCQDSKPAVLPHPRRNCRGKYNHQRYKKGWSGDPPSHSVQQYHAPKLRGIITDNTEYGNPHQMAVPIAVDPYWNRPR